MRKQVRYVVLAVTFLFVAAPGWAQTGKVAGTVTDAETGEPLPGVNIVVIGTQQGATTDTDGAYTILNVTPGTHDLQASFVGYTPQVVEGVQVNADLTTEQDFALQEETVGLDEVTVQAQEPIVDPDVSANVSNINMDQDMESVPVSSVQEVINLQAGIEDGLSIRGSGADEVKLMVDGLSVVNPRTREPFTGISLTAVDQVQVQTGGFSAKYGNVRSGLVSITTKQGPRDHYTADVIGRYSPPSRRHLGLAPNDPNAYLMRPFVTPGEDDLLAEDDVAYLGTHSEESPWDRYTRAQYPQFEGWKAVSEQLNNDDNPNNDLTPEQALEQFLWYHRKDFPAISGHTIDGSVGGPVPGVSDMLGDLRFFASYRQSKDPFIVPQRREAATDRQSQLKLTSDIASNIQLNVLGLYNKTRSQIGGTGYVLDRSSDIGRAHTWLFALDKGSLTNTTNTQIGAELTHTLGARTFYEVRLQRNSVSYEIGPGPLRDFDTIVTNIGEVGLNEAPFGFSDQIVDLAPSSMELSGRWGRNRDSSRVFSYDVQADLTSQITQYSELQTGVELHYTDYHSAAGIFIPVQPSVSNPKHFWHRKNAQGAVYLQNKLEFNSIVANLGLRWDYAHPLGSWYNYESFDQAFASNSIDELDRRPIEAQQALSPRLGVSFPVTENSKLYFNYGHFQSTQLLPELFNVTTVFGGTAVAEIGNPEMPFMRTVAYELGYDQNLFDVFLMRISGYYKALDDQPRYVRFSGRRGVAYSKPLPLNYEDIRGAEFTLEKNTGKWVRGEVNYTYMVSKEGDFGYGAIYEDRGQMREYIRQSGINFLNRPSPQPYANLRLEFRTPSEFGPQALGGHPFGDWRLGFLGFWQAGELFTYDGFQSGVEVDNNVRWRNFWNLDLRFTKNIESTLGSAKLFIDVSNILNLKRCCGGGFHGDFDYEQYMRSLHLPMETFEDAETGDPYLFPYGDDQPGVYRQPDTPFIPIETVSSLDNVSNPVHRPLYYVKEEGGGGTYMWYRDGAFSEANEEFVSTVLKNKQYIDMPNNTSYTFLNPRDIWLGMRITID